MKYATSVIKRKSANVDIGSNPTMFRRTIGTNMSILISAFAGLQPRATRRFHC